MISDAAILKFIYVMKINPDSTGSIDRHLDELLERLRSAEKALEFYADSENWTIPENPAKHQAYTTIFDDSEPGTDDMVGGYKARAHFKAVKNE